MDEKEYEIYVYICKNGKCPDLLKGPENKNKRGNFMRQRHKFKLDDSGHLLIKKEKIMKTPVAIENAPKLHPGEMPKENVHYIISSKIQTFFYKVVKKSKFNLSYIYL